MPKFYNSEVLDNGLNQIKSNANVVMHLIEAYAANDTYSVVTATNSLGSVAVGTGDMTLGDYGTLGRQLTIAQKTIISLTASGPTPDLHIALVDSSTLIVLAVTDETSDQVVSGGNGANIATFNLKMAQPT